MPFINTSKKKQRVAIAAVILFLTSTSMAQSLETLPDTPLLEPLINLNWQVEVIAFVHNQPDEAYRDRNDVDDYRDLPALAALLSAAKPESPAVIGAKTQQTIPAFADTTFVTTEMENVWQQIITNYQPLGYFRWQQPEGRGAWRRLHDDQPVTLDDNLSLGPHFELDGQVRITTDTIGFANLNLSHRTPVFITNINNPQIDSTSPLWRTLKLEQQRRIQPERIEYFDSAGLGLLILITPPDEPGETTGTEF